MIKEGILWDKDYESILEYACNVTIFNDVLVFKEESSVQLYAASCCLLSLSVSIIKYFISCQVIKSTITHLRHLCLVSECR